MSLRSRVLNRMFELLYGPLVFLHEPAGACLFGAAWHGRRIAIVGDVALSGPLLDLGCGSGRLLSFLGDSPALVVGVDVSKAMLRRASRDGALVVLASAARLPLPDSWAGTMVCTYPGAWIRLPEVWSEIERVLRPGGTLSILAGGTIERGRFARARRALVRLAYGRVERSLGTLELPLGNTQWLTGQLVEREDRWGTMYVWEGQRAG